MAHGLSIAGIAERLFLGLGTVKTHVAHILSKARAKGPRPSGRARVRVRLLEPDAVEPASLARDVPVHDPVTESD